MGAQRQAASTAASIHGDFKEVILYLPQGFKNITLLRLPPYAPELNPMENVWDYLRGNKLSSLVCDTYEAMRDASKEAWNFIANDAARITSIGTRDWACVNL